MDFSASQPTDLIIGKSLVTAETIAKELRARLIRRLTARHMSQDETLVIARNLLFEFEPILAQAITDAQLASWVVGVDTIATRLNQEVIERLTQTQYSFYGGDDDTHNFSFGDLFDGDDEPVVEFPRIQKAAESLANKRIVTPEEFKSLSAEMKSQAFTVAGDMGNDTIQTIRDVLSENIAKGASLREYEEALTEKIGTSKIGPAHLETVFRTNVQSAFRDGNNELESDPIVQEVFPFKEYIAVHDARSRSTHKMLEQLGLNGTNVYYTSDPFWDYFDPPWGYNCRCGTNLLTIEAAARQGVRDAQVWLRTGNPPIVKEYRLDKIPFRPDPGWSRRRVAA